MRLALVLLLVGCGSSSEPRQHDAPDVGLVEVGATPAPRPAVRTMKTVPLFGGSAIENLLIDPTLQGGDPGIGRWYSNFGTTITLDGPALGQLVLSAAPVGVSLPVGTIEDPSAKTFSLVAQVPGGTAPYSVSVWISTEKPLDVDIGSFIRVSLASGQGTGLSGIEIAHETEQTIGGRIWHRYRAEAPGPYAIGAYLTIRFRPSKHRWYLQSPEVIPKKLLPADTKMSLGRKIELEPEERGAIAAYQRIPLVYGVPTSASKPAR